MNTIFYYYHPNCFYFTEDLAGLDVIWPKEVRDIMVRRSQHCPSGMRQKKPRGDRIAWVWSWIVAPYNGKLGGGNSKIF